jgi:hypothetical protein
MPTMTENEIKAKIADGTFFGVSVDTAVFEKYGCNLDFRVLNRLDQFKPGPIKVLFSEIECATITYDQLKTGTLPAGANRVRRLPAAVAQPALAG